MPKVKRYRVFLLASVESESPGETIKLELVRVRAKTGGSDRTEIYSFVEGSTETEARLFLQKHELSGNLFAYFTPIPLNSDFVIIPEMVTIPDKP
jgi:hypothetical protein